MSCPVLDMPITEGTSKTPDTKKGAPNPSTTRSRCSCPALQNPLKSLLAWIESCRQDIQCCAGDSYGVERGSLESQKWIDWNGKKWNSLRLVSGEGPDVKIDRRWKSAESPRLRSRSSIVVRATRLCYWLIYHSANSALFTDWLDMSAPPRHIWYWCMRPAY